MRQMFRLSTCLLVSATVLWPLGVVRAADPALHLEPERGPCAVQNPPIVVRGSNFTPGQNIILGVARVGTDAGVLDPSGTVGADGTFTLQGRISGCGPTTPDGTQFRIYVRRLEGPPTGRQSPIEVLATAIFTVSASPSPLPGLPNTGGGGRQFWMPLPVSPFVAGTIAALLSVALRYVRLRPRIG